MQVVVGNKESTLPDLIDIKVGVITLVSCPDPISFRGTYQLEPRQKRSAAIISST